MAGDPYWSSVVLAAHLDGANNSTTFTELTGKTITPYGNAQIKTEQYKFGGSTLWYSASALPSAWMTQDWTIFLIWQQRFKE